MRWRRIAFWLTFSTLALIVLALTWLWTADLGVFKPQLERFVTEKTGREFAIDGEFHVDLAGTGSVVAENVRFQNAEWADDENMVTVGRVEVRFDLWSLIRGPLLVELIDVDNADIQLLRPEDGDPNWVLPIEVGGDEEDEDSSGLDILFGQVDIDRVSIVIESPDRNRPLHLDVEYLRQLHREDDFLDLELRATLDERQIAVDGEVGTWAALLAGRNFDFDIDAVLDTFEFSGSGRIDDVADLRRPKIEFTAAGPDIDDLTRMLGVGEEGEGNIDLIGSLSPQDGGPLALNVEGNIGQTEVEATGTVQDLQSLEDVGLKVLASGPDLGRILRIAGVHQVREAPFMLRIDAESRGSALVVNEATMVFAEAQIDASASIPNFPSPDDAVIKLKIKGPDIERFRYITGMPGEATGAFSLGFTVDVEEDGVEIVEMRLKTSLGEVRANGRLGNPDDLTGTYLDFSLKSDSLERFTDAYGIEGLPDYPFSITGAAEYVHGGIRTRGPVVGIVEDVTAKIDGMIVLSSGIKGSDFDFELTGPNLAELIGAFATPTGVPGQPYDVKGRLEIRDDGYRFRDVTGNIGRSAVDVDGLLNPVSGLSGTHFNFDIEGPEFLEIIDEVGGLEVHPGPYELSGSILLEPDMLTLSDIELDRATGDVRLDLGLGLPASRKWIDFDLRANGRDVRSLLRGFERFETFEQPFSVDARGNLRGDHMRYDKFNVGVGDATVTAVGDLDLEEMNASTEFSYDLQIPSLAQLGTIDGRRLSDQAFSVYAHVVGGGGVLEFDQIVLKIGESDVNGYVRFQTGDVPELKVDVYSDALVFAPFLEEEEEGFEYDPEPEFDDGRLIPDIPIPFDALKKLNVSVDVDIKLLQRGPLLMRDIVFDADLRDGLLDIPVAGFNARSGALIAKASLDPADGAGAASFKLVARNFALGINELNQDMAMTGDVDINLRAHGNDLRALLGSMNGVFFVNARGGRMTNNRLMRAIYGDLLEEILGTINPFRQTDPYTDFECIVAPLEAVDGQLTGAPHSFVATSKIRIATKSSINLKTEEMRVGIRTTPRRALSISAGELVNPYVQVVGTLAAPRLAVDETGLLITGGAAVATGGLSLLAKGLWDRVSRSRDPCEQVSGQAIEALGDRFPDLKIEESVRPE